MRQSTDDIRTILLSFGYLFLQYLHYFCGLSSLRRNLVMKFLNSNMFSIYRSGLIKWQLFVSLLYYLLQFFITFFIPSAFPSFVSSFIHPFFDRSFIHSFIRSFVWMSNCPRFIRSCIDFCII